MYVVWVWCGVCGVCMCVPVWCVCGVCVGVLCVVCVCVVPEHQISEKEVPTRQVNTQALLYREGELGCLKGGLGHWKWKRRKQINRLF